MGGKLSYPRDDIPADKTFIVTGGNTGIGYQTAKCIAKLGGRVIIACRSEQRAKEAIEKMQKEHQEEVKQDIQGQEGASVKEAPTAPDAKEEKGPTASADKEDTAPAAAADGSHDIQPLKVEFMKLDLGSLASTMEFINAYKSKGYPLHVLICNAGLGLVPFQKTEDGYEIQFQVNYLSHFLITLHLLPLLRESAPNSRIINVSSMVHSSGTFDLKNMQAEASYDRLKFYGNSKVYQIMNMYALNRRLKSAGISIFSVHPGYVDSEFSRGSADSKLHSFIETVSQAFNIKRKVEEGAMTSLVAALDTSYDGRSGLYFKDCKVANPSSLSRNIEKQEALWEYSLDCIRNYVSEDVLKDLQIPKAAATQVVTPAAAAEADLKPEVQDSKSEEGANKSKDTTPEVDEPKPDDGTKSSEDGADAKSKEELESKPEENAESKPGENVESKPEEGEESKPAEGAGSEPNEVGKSEGAEEVGESKPEQKDDEEQNLQEKSQTTAEEVNESKDAEEGVKDETKGPGEGDKDDETTGPDEGNGE